MTTNTDGQLFRIVSPENAAAGALDVGEIVLASDAEQVRSSAPSGSLIVRIVPAGEREAQREAAREQARRMRAIADKICRDAVGRRIDDMIVVDPDRRHLALTLRSTMKRKPTAIHLRVLSETPEMGRLASELRGRRIDEVTVDVDDKRGVYRTMRVRATGKFPVAEFSFRLLDEEDRW